jgi:hypothetical protein
MKSLCPQGDAFSIRLILICEGAGRNIIVTTQTRFLTREILLVFSPELVIERCRMTVTASDRPVLTYIVMMTVGTFVTILINMIKMSKNNPAATVIQNNTGRVFLHCGREKKSGNCRNGQDSNN